MKPSITHFFFFLIFLNFHAGIYAQNRPVFPRIEPDSKAIEYYNLDNNNLGYSWTELAEISLWASGNATPSNIERISSAVFALNISDELPLTEREKAEFILSYMHRNILRTYSIFQTRIDTIFTNGSFNCVSSAVLYIILCESAGINASGVITRDHAFVTVHINGEDIDVETTNRYGFDPGNRREFHDQFGRLTGFSYVPAQNYRDRQTISKIELISLILNNRISEHERANRYADAVPLAVDRAALLLGNSLAVNTGPVLYDSLFTDPRIDLMDRLFNYGNTLLRANREEDAIIWANFASSNYPDYNRWYDFYHAAVNNRIVRFLRENRTADAGNFLENNRSILTNENYAQFDSTIIDADLVFRTNRITTAAQGDAITGEIEQAQRSGRISDRRAVELIVYTIQRTAASLSAAPARDWRAAINYIEAAVSRFGSNREWEQALQTYRSNLAADYHNRFAAEWNRRNYDEAEQILNEGLAEFPDNRQLLSNLDIVNRSRSR